MKRLPIVAVILLAISPVASLPLSPGGSNKAEPGRRRPASASGASSASGFLTYKFPTGQPGCTGVGFNTAPSFAFDRQDCGFVVFALSPAPKGAGPIGKAKLLRPGTADAFAEVEVGWADGEAQFSIEPQTDWPAGVIDYQIFVGNETTSAGGAFFRHNFLGADITETSKPDGAAYQPGEAIPITGELYELDIVGLAEMKTPVAGGYSVRVSTAAGTKTFGPYTADAGGDGNIEYTIPASATAGLVGRPENGYRMSITIEVIDTSYDDPGTGAWASEIAGSLPLQLSTAPTSLIIENNYVSAVGWVKPGDTYPFRVLVQNFQSTAAAAGRVSIPPVDGTTFTRVAPAGSAGSASIGPDGSIVWNLGSVGPAGPAGPAVKTLVVEARADSTAQDPQIVWKNLSSTATLTYAGGPAGLSSTSRGPKVIPPGEAYETARYGYRPFPVVPVDYVDRKHGASHSGDRLTTVINSADYAGSTYNLYQEMSLGQLFPNGTVPSAGIATAGFDYEPGFEFTALEPSGTCRGGATIGDVAGSEVYPDRIVDGWYQLPGNTDYYGDDEVVSEGYWGQVGLRVGDIDSACGPTAKAVYDAASIADPEIDYSEYDTDKDGVVDFFMMVFVGVGGHGESQFEVPPYDNIWPHSSSLEFTYTSDEGNGYVSDDQLKDLEGRPLYWTDAGRSAMTTAKTAQPVYVRVGPYNVNPETAIDHASVISHEYGHSLGLPDFYSGGGRESYGDWNLMATDKSQNMDIFSKQELGWIVPRVLKPGETRVQGWKDSKVNTHRIDWVRPDGTPYTLQGPTVDNAEAYVAKLPARRVIDPAKVEQGASPSHIWWSTSGNDFGCPPAATGKSLDVYLPELEKVPAGTPIEVSFASMWNIEWDYDYGFVMYSTDGGKSYASLPSENGYTTPSSQNPTSSACQAKYGNGLTGTSGSYEAGTQEVDRTGVADQVGIGSSYPEPVFLEDSYDLSDAAGKATVLRFAYYTDPGLALRGWFIDDLKITAGGKLIYGTDFEPATDLRLFPGGCQEGGRVAATCTKSWQRVNASAGAPFDHAYYLELRDRSGFDMEGRGQNDRSPIGFSPGALLVYSNEAHGYGNVGFGDPPPQSPIDSQPQPESETPNLNDAAFTAASGDNRFSDSGKGHVDNYTDPDREDGLWRFDFNCLTFDVLAMRGDEVGPETAPGDLTADVRFTLGSGCASFDYGHAAATKPKPKPPAKVLGGKTQLPATGLGDAAGTLGLAAIALAAGLAAAARKGSRA